MSKWETWDSYEIASDELWCFVVEEYDTQVCRLVYRERGTGKVLEQRVAIECIDSSAAKAIGDAFLRIASSMEAKEKGSTERRSSE